MKPILFTFTFLLFTFCSYSQRVDYPPATSSVYLPYGQNSTYQLKSTLWSDDISDPLNWSFANSSVPVNDWTLETDPDVVSLSGPFQSTSAANGFLFFKADTASGSTSDAYVAYAGSTIDLTGEPNIRIQFEQQYISDSNQRTLEVSQDGITWLPFVISDGLSPTGAKEDDVTSIDISSAAGNASDLHFRFHFSGFQEGYWAIDDIELRSIDSVDLRALSVDWGRAGDWGIRMPYYSIIPSQVVGVEFCAIVANDGLVDVDSAEYTVEIFPGPLTYSETFSIQAGSIDTVCLLAPFTTSGFTDYTVNHSISVDSTEVNILNNALESFQFREDQSLWSTYARDDFYTGVQGGIRGVEELGAEYGVANVFDFFNSTYCYGMQVHIHPDAVQSEIDGYLYRFDTAMNEWVPVDATFPYVIQPADIGQTVDLLFVSGTAMQSGESYLMLAKTYSLGDSSVIFATSGKSKPNTSFYQYFENGNNLVLSYLTETPMVRLLFNPEGLNENQYNFNFNIAPNPTNESTTLSFDLPSSSKVSFEIVDLSGKLAHRVEPNLFQEGTNEFQLNTTDLHNGVYFVKFTSDYGSTTKRIGIQH
ncbi:MAG: T9SS type A sorting domain-containing protein [Crocinitomicaceae bacterium]|nr:T9SS type A sorting domain-containing protein [Crocinitomicaceae bacterium]